MASIVIPKEGKVCLNSLICTGIGSTDIAPTMVQLQLITATATGDTLTDDTVIGNLTFATYEGYTATGLGDVTDLGINGSDQDQMIFAPMPFVCTSAPSPSQTIIGWVVTCVDYLLQPRLMFGVIFDEPVDIVNVGDACPVLPQFAFTEI